MSAAKPILAPVDPAAASQLSPWPQRLAGEQPWRRPAAGQDGRAEYEQGWYAELLAKWVAFSGRLGPQQRHPGAVLRFFDEVRRANNAAMRDNPAVYGTVDLRAYLVSVADALYAADVNLFELLYRAFIAERAAAAQAQHPFEALVEIGCGNGGHLFNAYLRLGLSSVAGCDLSPSAVVFLRRVAADVGVPGTFAAGDYRSVPLLEQLAPASSPWALLSVHAIEQAEALPGDWFERLARLKRPPAVGMHFEPLHWPDDAPFARQCARYAELNGYNQSFADAAQAAQAAGLIRIVQAERRVLGLSAYNPTSVLVWVPAGGARP